MKVVIVLFALFAFAYANIYNVTVQLGSQRFAKVENATLNLVVVGARHWNNGSISRDHFKVQRGDLLPSRNFTAEVSMPFELNDITNTTLYWTQPTNATNTPSPRIPRKVVFLDHVMVTDTEETGRRTGKFGITKFIPANKNQAIAHRQEAQLKLKYHSE